ncbi:transposase for insertion sequence element IS4351 [Neisseria meningitidis NM2795]|nr:putative transposase [Neisseria meningitidis 93003]EJU76890.1 transposase for insertion sequence element IS4351 [Neisseria meningitidis NM2795]
MSYTQLTQGERYHIQYLSRHCTVTEIAKQLNRHKSTISREIRRHRTQGQQYSAEKAQRQSRTIKQRKRQPYYYGDYPDTVYEGLKNDDTSLGKQTEKMEKYFVEAGNKKMNAAPGAHAHLGLLLSRSGDKEGAFRQFEEEKRLFPEISSIRS